VLLIFDEVLTGFRLSIGGAQEFFNVKPDLSSFAKAMANGYPISAYGGRKDIMKKLDDIVLTANLCWRKHFSILCCYNYY
jgi:glutamate-1-semialdehyde 2,1-aminomutase